MLNQVLTIHKDRGRDVGALCYCSPNPGLLGWGSDQRPRSDLGFSGSKLIGHCSISFPPFYRSPCLELYTMGYGSTHSWVFLGFRVLSLGLLVVLDIVLRLVVGAWQCSNCSWHLLAPSGSNHQALSAAFLPSQVCLLLASIARQDPAHAHRGTT
jgi:hypothetical protein